MLLRNVLPLFKTKNEDDENIKCHVINQVSLIMFAE